MSSLQPLDLNSIPDIGMDPLRYCLREKIIKDSGLWLEFGVWEGHTLDLISQHTENTVYGFDTFSGVDTDWSGTPSGSMKSFDIGGSPPAQLIPIDPKVRYGPNTGSKRPFKNNVKFITGLFCDTLPRFLKVQQSTTPNVDISFLHIDCDIYESTMDIFRNCAPFISSGCIVVFDELVNYQGYQEHELRAFTEFIDSTSFSFEWVGMDGHVWSDLKLQELGNYEDLDEKRQEWAKNNMTFSVAVRLI